MSSPIVDVIIAVHQSERPIARAVASVLEGNKVPIRVLVIAHNIAPEKIRGALGPWAEDPRVVVLELRDGIPSPSGPMNFGYDNATARFTTLLGSDDELQPGALDRWVGIAEDPEVNADFVIANRREPGGEYAPSPPVRPQRRNHLSGTKDRLAYRAAPLGLLRRSKFGHLRFVEGVPTGEDIAFSAEMWFSDASISFAFGEPGYLVHADQEERITTTVRSVDAELSWMEGVLEAGRPWMRRAASRRALLVKILRQNIPDAVAGRLPSQWDEVADRQLREHVRRVWRIDSAAFGYLSRAEWNLMRALMRGDTSARELQRLLEERGRIRSVDSLIPHDLAKVLAAQSPLRYHVAGATLVREWRR